MFSIPAFCADSTSASEMQIVARARWQIQRTSHGARRIRTKSSSGPPEIEPSRLTTNGLAEKSATTPPASHIACTRSASRASRRSVRIIESASRGAIQGRRRTACMIPPPW